MHTAFSEAAERNKQPILEKLRPLLAHCKSVLEIGSGTGQHATFFAAALSHLTWQPTELPEKLPVLSRVCRNSPAENLKTPLPLGIDEIWPVLQADAVFTANTLHIIHWPQVCRLFYRVSEILPDNGLFCTYGPFNINGRFTSESNAQFDNWLKKRDPASGIRNRGDLQRAAKKWGLWLHADYAMPANNRLLVWHNTATRTRS